MIINVESSSLAGYGQSVSSSGTASLKSLGECRLQLSASALASDRPVLALGISAMTKEHAGERIVGNISTTITVEPDHPVVLGCTPIGSLETIFVVEVLKTP
jgi:hypothetical protein